MPLRVIIIGAGVAGLTTAVSLRRAGHEVKILERSTFAAEVGAALNLAPNGTRMLRELGFDEERAHCVQMMNWDTVNGVTLDRVACQDVSRASERFGAPYVAVHRVDLHEELMRLAAVNQPDGVVLHLSSTVVQVYPEEGRVKLEDGSVEQADLIVGADGLHSVARAAVISSTAKFTGLSAFRFLVPTEVLENDRAGRELLDWKTPGATMFVDPGSVAVDQERHLMWYPCRRQEPLGEVVKCWPLFQIDPLPTWARGKLVLIGDAAHPMLPFGGQGSNQAIEDGAAIGFLLANVDDEAQVPQRLQLFDQVRRRRASRVQILSSVRANREAVVEDKVKQFMEDGVICGLTVSVNFHPWLILLVPNSFAARVAHDA
ncbi:hypothetical protein N7474_010288, partial [Penicillium riverlandense]|uniref:uncharacterized protein n=1 Tax=Penicillium riverlandense TaxID=1903569 RepID=UPI0025491FF1